MLATLIGTSMEIRVRSLCAILEQLWLDMVLYIIKYTFLINIFIDIFLLFLITHFYLLNVNC